MKFRPIREDHSVDAVGFVITVDEALSRSEIEDLKASADDGWIDLMPSKEKIQSFSVSMSPGEDGPAKQAFLEWLQYTRKNPDGTNSWELRFFEDQLVLICRDYTRWAKIWPRCRDILYFIFSKLPHRAAKKMLLEIGDSFFAPDDDTYDLGDLISTSSNRIPAKISDYGGLWHLHQGWFSEPAIEGVPKYLEQLNIHSTQIDRKYLVRIQHTISYHIDNPISLKSVETILPLFDLVINYAHDQNKNILREILTPEAQQRISLDKKEV